MAKLAKVVEEKEVLKRKWEVVVEKGRREALLEYRGR